MRRETRKVPVPNIARFDNEAAALEALPVKRGGVLLYGSSVFARWHTAESDLAPYRTVNRGFGGSTAEEAFYYYPQLVRPCAPSALVWCEGNNDYAYGYSPHRVFEFSTRVFALARSDFENIPILILSAKLTPAHPEADAHHKAYNALMRDYAENRGFAGYVESNDVLYSGGSPNLSLFEADGEHISPEAYSRLAFLIKAELSRLNVAP